MSTALMELQKKIGATVDGSFGPNTLRKAANYFKLTDEQAAHFFGQCSHESAGFNIFVENLNYSATGLRQVFGKYFPNETIARQYARQPAKIASRVYANRMGNGNEASQQGWLYRGRGALQTTGRFNYVLLSDHLKDPTIITNPDVVATKYAFESAKFYFDNNKLWDLCKTVDNASITAVTRRVNGGTNGLADRMSLTKRYYGWLKAK